MESSDLDHFEAAATPILVFGQDRGCLWMNRRARRLFPGRFRSALLRDLQQSESIALATGAANGQAGSFPARLDTAGETHRGTLRRLDPQRLLFEIVPPQADAFQQLTQRQRRAQAALAEELRNSERLRLANDRLRDTARDIVSAAVAPLTDLGRLVDRLRLLDAHGQLGLKPALEDAARRLGDAEAQIGVLQALTEENFMVDATEIVRPQGLIARVCSDGAPDRRRRLAGVRLAPLPSLLGNVLLARRLFDRLLSGLVEVGTGPSPAITVEGSAGDHAAEVRIAMACATPAEAETAADRSGCAHSAHLAQQIGWRLTTQVQGSLLTLTLTAPVCPEDRLRGRRPGDTAPPDEDGDADGEADAA